MLLFIVVVVILSSGREVLVDPKSSSREEVNPTVQLKSSQSEAQLKRNLNQYKVYLRTIRTVILMDSEGTVLDIGEARYLSSKRLRRGRDDDGRRQGNRGDP